MQQAEAAGPPPRPRHQAAMAVEDKAEGLIALAGMQEKIQAVAAAALANTTAEVNRRLA